MFGDFREFKVGDMVIVAHWRYGSSRSEIARISAITPKGFLKVGEQLYYTNGGVRGDGGSHLIVPTEELIKEIREESAIRKANHLMDTKSPTYKQALAIIKAFELTDDDVVE